MLLAGGALLLVVWAFGVTRTLELGVQRKICPGVGTVVCWSAVATLAGYFGYEWLRAARPGLHWLAVPAFLVLATVSSGTETAARMGDGNELASFKTLSLWFKENMQPGDKLMTNMPHYMSLYTDLPSDCFVHTGSIPPEKAPDFPSFLNACRQMGVTLIAWDSGLANNPKDRYYKLWGLERIRPLGLPFMGRSVERVGPCTLVHLIAGDTPRIAVWRLGPGN